MFGNMNGINKLYHPKGCIILLVMISESYCLQISRLSTIRASQAFSPSPPRSSSPSTSLRWKVHHHRQKVHPTTLFMSSQKQQSDQASSKATASSKPPLYVDLTPQERILKEALGIEPESEEEKRSRQNKRMEELSKIKNEQRKKIVVAIIAFAAACMNYFWQFTHPVSSLQLLTEMQMKSDDVALIGKNGKPTVVDFWAPWCENCKSAAPTLSLIEDEYRNKVNFVMVNGDLRESWPLIERFGVDAIPHLAMIGSDGYVETALIGPIPRSVLEADLDTMIENGKRRSSGGDLVNGGINSSISSQQQLGAMPLPYDVDSSANQQQQGKIQLPYTMYDAFRSRPDERNVSF